MCEGTADSCSNSSGAGALRAEGFLLTGVTFGEDPVKVGKSTFDDST